MNPIVDPMTDGQAECIVRALDRYIDARENGNENEFSRREAREFLVKTLAASMRMSEPHKSDLQK